MITAAKARQIATETDKLKKTAEEINWAITTAANGGKYTTDYYHEIPEELIEKLQENGFKVTTNEFHGYFWNTIYWMDGDES